MNQTSQNIINLVRDINGEQEDNKNIAAYSVDAGFHVFLFCLQENEEAIY